MDQGADGAPTPAQPLVHVEIDQSGRVVVDGCEQPHARLIDSRALADLAVLAVARDHAEPLGRGVRTVARTPTEHSMMVVHPDGSVTDLEPYHPFTASSTAMSTAMSTASSTAASSPVGVPAATRAQHWLAAREAERAVTEDSTAHRRRRALLGRPLVLGLAAASVVAVLAAAALAWPGQDTDTTDRSGSDLRDAAGAPADASSEAQTGAAAAQPPEAAPAQAVLGATRLVRAAVDAVDADAEPGVLLLALDARRPTPVKVVVRPLGDDARAADVRRMSFSIREATTRRVSVDGLAPGSYRWAVKAPGMTAVRGQVDVPAAPVEVVPVVAAPPPSDTSTDIQPAAPPYTPPPAPPPPPAPTSPPAGGGQAPPEPQASGGGNGPFDPSTDPTAPCDPDDGC